jgi:hypothetical protein
VFTSPCFRLSFLVSVLLYLPGAGHGLFMVVVLVWVWIFVCCLRSAEICSFFRLDHHFSIFDWIIFVVFSLSIYL